MQNYSWVKFPLGLIADDLTGASDTGVQFAQDGLDTMVYLGELMEHDYSDVMAVNTSSRYLQPQKAYQICENAAKALLAAGASSFYKKIDSVMRGNIGAEIDAVLAASGIEKAIVCPSYPQMGRTLLRGILQMDGIPLANCGLAHDIFTSSSSKGRAAEIIAKQSKSALTEIFIDDVEKGAEKLAEKLENSLTGGRQVFVVDALSRGHLHTIARAAGLLSCQTLPVGSGGLASALSGQPDGVSFKLPENRGRGVLLICGSPSAMAAEQLEFARVRGELSLFSYTPKTLINNQYDVSPIIKLLNKGKNAAVRVEDSGLTGGDAIKLGRKIEKSLAELCGKILQDYYPGALIFIGGETALAVCMSLGSWGLRLLGEVVPGVPCGTLQGKWYRNLPIITKSGSFGDTATISKVLSKIYRGPSSQNTTNFA